MEPDRPADPSWRRTAAAVWALMVLALVAAGCGGDDEEPAAPAEESTTLAEDELSREDYVAEVREAVGPIATESQELIRQATNAERVQDLAEPLADAEEVYRNAAAQLESLEPPSEVDDLHDRLVTVQQDIADAAQSAERSARRGEREGLEELRRAGQRYRNRAERLSQEFGERGFEF